MDTYEITLPETKPALEWIMGRVVQKVSPKRRHSLLQGEFARRMIVWARGRGEVGTEWRFRIAPIRRYRVSSCCYLGFSTFYVALVKLAYRSGNAS